MRLLKIALIAAYMFPAIAGQAQSPTFKLNGNELVLPSPIQFEKGSATLAKSSNSALQHIKDYLDAKSYISALRVEGHADGQALSEQRAMAVCRWLVSAGVDCHRLVPVGFGDTKPIADAPYNDDSGNVRIAVVNAALRGRAIGGMPLDGGGAVAGEPCD